MSIIILTHCSTFSSEFDDVPAYLKLSNFGILFRDKTVMNTIAFPTKVAEYLACGNALIVSDGLFEVIKIIENYNVGVSIDINKSNMIDDCLKIYNKFNVYKRRRDRNYFYSLFSLLN